MRGRLYAVFAGFAAALAGCLLTTSLDGLSGGAGAATDGGSDASSADSSSDASTDAPIDVAEGGPADFRCAMLSSTPAFCTDFDVGTLGTIITPSTALGGAVTLDESVFRSPSRSLKLTTPMLTSGAGGSGHASVTRSFGFAPQSSIAIQFDLRIDSVDATALNAVSIGMGGYNLSLFLGGTAKIREGIPSDAGLVYTATDRTAPAFAKWIHVSLTVTIADDASHVVLAYDGMAQSALPLVIDRYRASWAVDVGLNFVMGPADSHELHIDNLVVDAK